MDEELSPAQVREFWLHEFEFRRADVAERVKYQHEFAIAALKSLMLANGGAILAILTFIGNAEKVSDASSIKEAMLFYGTGLVAGLATYFGAYMSQGTAMQATSYQLVTAQAGMAGTVPDPAWEKARSRYLRSTSWLINSSVLLALTSLGLFGVGCWKALNGIL